MNIQESWRYRPVGALQCHATQTTLKTRAHHWMLGLIIILCAVIIWQQSANMAGVTLKGRQAGDMTSRRTVTPSIQYSTYCTPCQQCKWCLRGVCDAAHNSFCDLLWTGAAHFQRLTAVVTLRQSNWTIEPTKDDIPDLTGWSDWLTDWWVFNGTSTQQYVPTAGGAKQAQAKKIQCIIP